MYTKRKFTHLKIFFFCPKEPEHARSNLEGGAGLFLPLARTHTHTTSSVRLFFHRNFPITILFLYIFHSLTVHSHLRGLSSIVVLPLQLYNVQNSSQRDTDRETDRTTRSRGTKTRMKLGEKR